MTGRYRRTRLWARALGSTCLLTLVLTPCSARGESSTSERPLPDIRSSESGGITIDVYGGIRDLYKIAVPTPGGDAAVARQVQSVASRDLELSSLFKVLDRRSFGAVSEPAGLAIDADAWRDVGAQGVIKARAETNDGQLQLELRFIEVAGSGKAALSRSFRGSPEKAVGEAPTEMVTATSDRSTSLTIRATSTTPPARSLRVTRGASSRRATLASRSWA